MNYEQFRQHPFVQLEPDAYRIYVEKLQLTMNSVASHVAVNSAQSSSGLGASSATDQTIVVADDEEERKEAADPRLQ